MFSWAYNQFITGGHHLASDKSLENRWILGGFIAATLWGFPQMGVPQ